MIYTDVLLTVAAATVTYFALAIFARAVRKWIR